MTHVVTAVVYQAGEEAAHWQQMERAIKICSVLWLSAVKRSKRRTVKEQNLTFKKKKKAKRLIKRRCFKKRSQDRSCLSLQFFRSVQSTCTELLKVIEKYQDRITRESDSESASQWGRNSRCCYIRALRRHTTNHYGWTFCWCVQLSRI